MGKPRTLARELRLAPRRRLLISLLVSLLLLALGWADHQGLWSPRGGDWARYHGQRFTVVKVVDGDTLDVAAPDDGKPHTRVRLWGINAPETAKPRFRQAGEPWADQATDRLQALCLQQPVRLWLEANRIRDRYGRLLAHIELPDGTLANETLLLEGLARDDERWAHGKMQRYRVLAEQARRGRLGVWSGATAVVQD